MKIILFSLNYFFNSSFYYYLVYINKDYIYIKKDI